MGIISRRSSRLGCRFRTGMPARTRVRSYGLRWPKQMRRAGVPGFFCLKSPWVCVRSLVASGWTRGSPARIDSFFSLSDPMMAGLLRVAARQAPWSAPPLGRVVALGSSLNRIMNLLRCGLDLLCVRSDFSLSPLVFHPPIWHVLGIPFGGWAARFFCRLLPFRGAPGCRFGVCRPTPACRQTEAVPARALWRGFSMVVMRHPEQASSARGEGEVVVGLRP